MRVLLTAFEPFDTLEVNPSQVIAEEIARRGPFRGDGELHTEILPVEYVGAAQRIQELLAESTPDALVSLGVSPGVREITLERLAHNLDSAEIPDNAGNIVSERTIAPDGPASYESTLPLEGIAQALKERRIPVALSDNAGSYVCNHVFYMARHTIEQSGTGTLCGFIHLPLMTEQCAGNKCLSLCLPRSVMREAVECCLDILREHISAGEFET